MISFKTRKCSYNKGPFFKRPLCWNLHRPENNGERKMSLKTFAQVGESTEGRFIFFRFLKILRISAAYKSSYVNNIARKQSYLKNVRKWYNKQTKQITKITKTNIVKVTKKNNVQFVWWFKNDVGHPITHCIALTNLTKTLVFLINQILSTV